METARVGKLRGGLEVEASCCMLDRGRGLSIAQRVSSVQRKGSSSNCAFWNHLAVFITVYYRLLPFLSHLFYFPLPLSLLAPSFGPLLFFPAFIPFLFLFLRC